MVNNDNKNLKNINYQQSLSPIHNSRSNWKSEPNLNNKLNEKLDTWRNWPDYAVEQETDTSLISNEANNISWIKEQENNICHRLNSIKLENLKHPSRPQNVEFKIEIEKRKPKIDKMVGPYSTTRISIDKKQPNTRIYANKEGRVSIENLPLMPGGNEIVINSNLISNSAPDSNKFTNNANQIGRTSSRLSSNLMVPNETDTAATRISSGYFSGDEFRSYCLNNNSNLNQYYDVNSNLLTSGSPTFSSLAENPSNQFNINRFLSNNSSRYKFKNEDAIEDLNRMYKSIGLEEEDEKEQEENEYKESEEIEEIELFDKNRLILN
jgi:hypothetical protein